MIFVLQVIVQSNTDQYDKKPKIIPLFEVGTGCFIPDNNLTDFPLSFQSLKPNRECLEFVYKIMKSKLRL